MSVRVHLSSRELEVLRLVAHGRSSDEIAADLFLSVLTVRSYMKQVINRLGAHDRAHAVGIGYQSGLLSLPAQEKRR